MTNVTDTLSGMLEREFGLAETNGDNRVLTTI